ncbi:MAG TPA: xanthine dehydrogenase subunit D [Conexibacter sp.]|nr:xanthine dehydrogenase subunit D [Conexibacter sp.]
MAVTVPTETPSRGIGASPTRPDGREKVQGEFAYASDLHADGMLWGATLRSPHPYARIRSIDIGPALARPGVRAVLTHDDVPGAKHHGLKIADQPVLACDVVRYHGEAVALVAADHPETARRAAAEIVVDYEPLEPLVDADAALADDAPRLHEAGNVVRHVAIQRGDVAGSQASADVIVRGTYEIGMQDQAFLGPEAGLAIPTEDGVELHVATQWLHDDRRQVAACLGLAEEHVKIVCAGVGGAFGGREDLSMQVHACMLALHTNRPVKMSYGREESFFGHVHRHPARIAYEHGATADGRIVYVKGRVLFDGGAYASKSTAVCLTASLTSVGPYVVPNVGVDVYAVYTNNPPCGAMRGFGAVQTCFAYEAQMDKLAEALGMDPVEVRRRNALHTGARLPVGQRVDGPAPVAEMLERLRAMPLPDPAPANGDRDLRSLPGGVSNTTHGEGVRRGVGYAIGFKNVGLGGGVVDYSTANVRLIADGDEVRAEVRTAACEVGQGGVIVQAQIVRDELGIDRVDVLPADTTVGNAGCTAGSRQTWFTGGAVKVTCEAVRDELLRRAVERHGAQQTSLRLQDGAVVTGDGERLATIAELVADDPLEETREYWTRRTQPIDDETGQGDAFVALGFAAHRAVVDVDVELGLVRVVEIATVQDVGRVMNPMALEGQIEGGIAQGLGLAVMEEIQVRDGVVRNPSFTDYLIPTILDMPPVKMDIMETPQPGAPYGLNGVGEPPTIASTPAIVSALRAATGVALTRVPVRPEAIVGIDAAPAPTWELAR